MFTRLSTSPTGTGWKKRHFFIRSLQGGTDTQVSILGQNEEMMEYQVRRSPKTIFSVTDEGIFVNVIKAQTAEQNLEKPIGDPL
jgi:hypothetical protein